MFLLVGFCASAVYDITSYGATIIDGKSGDLIRIDSHMDNVFGYGFKNVFNGAIYTYGTKTYTLNGPSYDFSTGNSASSISLTQSGPIMFLQMPAPRCNLNAFATGNDMTLSMFYDSGTVCIIPAIHDAGSRTTITYGTSNPGKTTAILYTDSEMGTLCANQTCEGKDLAPGFFVAYRGSTDQETDTYTLNTKVKESQDCAYHFALDPTSPNAELLWASSFSQKCRGGSVTKWIIVGSVVVGIIILGVVIGVAYYTRCLGLFKRSGWQSIPQVK